MDKVKHLAQDGSRLDRRIAALHVKAISCEWSKRLSCQSRQHPMHMQLQLHSPRLSQVRRDPMARVPDEGDASPGHREVAAWEAGR